MAGDYSIRAARSRTGPALPLRPSRAAWIPSRPPNRHYNPRLQSRPARCRAPADRRRRDESLVNDIVAWLPKVASIAGAGLAILLASLVVWTGRDAAARTDSRLLQLVSVLVVLTLNVIGLVVYLLLRAPETLAERREREMIEAILTREVTGQFPRK